MSKHLARGFAVIGVCAAIAACAKMESKADSAMAAEPAAKAAAAATPPPAAALTDANIAALLDVENANDSIAGPVIQAHLAKAQDIQAKLSSAPATAKSATPESAKKK